MNQIVLGLLPPFILFLLYYTAKKGRASIAMLIVMPIAMAISAIWAVAPDIPRLLGMKSLYMRLAHDPRMNIFYWHYNIDQIESNPPTYIAYFIIISMTVLYIGLRELKLRENE